MPNTNALSGKNYERALIAEINDRSEFANAHKPAQPSFKDRGDIRFSTVLLQAKHIATGTKTIHGYLCDAEDQAAQHPEAEYLTPAAVVHLPCCNDVEDDLVVLRLSSFLDLVHERDNLDDILSNQP